MTLRGIDISDHQSDLTIARLDPAPQFVVVKATEGKGYVSPSWQGQYNDAKQLGMLTGLYHFARNDLGGETRPVEEADYFLKQAEPVAGEALFVLDWEVGDLGEVAWVKAWLDRVYERTNVRAAVYMSEWPARNYDWSAVAADHPLWVAKYADDVVDNGWAMESAGPMPSVPGWPWSIWQWTSKGKISGYSGLLDLNYSLMMPNDWREWAGKELEVAGPCPTLEEIDAAVEQRLTSFFAKNTVTASVPGLRAIVREEVAAAVANLSIPSSNEIAAAVSNAVRVAVRAELDAERTLTVELPVTMNKTT